MVETSGERPAGDIVIVSSVRRKNATEYRVVGIPVDQDKATSTEPSLKDGYMWLMRQQVDVSVN